MIRTLALSGLALAALAAGGCNMAFKPIQPDVASPIERMDRAEGERQRAAQTHPDCLMQRGDTSRTDQERLRQGCERMGRDQ